MENAEAQLNRAETLLAHLLCAKDATTFVSGDQRDRFTQFAPMSPRAPYAAQLSGDRIFSTSPSMLLEPVQDLLGQTCEGALLGEDFVKWVGIRKMNKAPRGCWASVPRPTWYEFHFMWIGQSGEATYQRDLVALKSSGLPARIAFNGLGVRGAHVNETAALTAISIASMVEDAHRPGALLATITDGSSVVVPVPIGEHKDLFALRDAPLTSAGKRKAILHWVVRHMRQTKRERVSVSEHWRGARALSVGGLRVTLGPNE